MSTSFAAHRRRQSSQSQDERRGRHPVHQRHYHRQHEPLRGPEPHQSLHRQPEPHSTEVTHTHTLTRSVFLSLKDISINAERSHSDVFESKCLLIRAVQQAQTRLWCLQETSFNMLYACPFSAGVVPNLWMSSGQFHTTAEFIKHSSVSCIRPKEDLGFSDSLEHFKCDLSFRNVELSFSHSSGKVNLNRATPANPAQGFFFLDFFFFAILKENSKKIASRWISCQVLWLRTFKSFNREKKVKTNACRFSQITLVWKFCQRSFNCEEK